MSSGIVHSDLSEPIDWWAVSPRGNECLTYFFMDADKQLLYVGVTSQPYTRWRTHSRQKEWWPRVAHIYSMAWPHREDALWFENELIHRWRPPFNIVHNPLYGGR